LPNNCAGFVVVSSAADNLKSIFQLFICVHSMLIASE
jgi:hypothetical protein